MAVLVKMSFGLTTGVCPSNRVLVGVQIPCERDNFEEKGMPRHSRRHCDVNCAKMTEPIDLPFGLWIRLGGSKHKFNRIRQVAPMCPHGRTMCPHGRAH